VSVRGVLSIARNIVRVASANFLEMYSFMLFAYYATYIARDMFPSNNEFASIMLTLGTFGTGFLMRPLGAVILGIYTERHGRRPGLILTLGLMGVGTALIALTPTYRSIGILAPLIVLAGCILQGLSAGVMIGGVTAYLAEISTPGHRGFYCSWQSASQQISVISTAVIGLVLISTLTPASMAVWGWRIPFVIGTLIVPFLLIWLVKSMPETEAFLSRKQRPGVSQLLAIIGRNWKLIGMAVMICALNNINFYLITAYTPTFGVRELHLTARASFFVTLIVALSSFAWLPIGGALSDKVGRKPQLIFFAVITLITAYPAMLWLVSSPSVTRLLIVELWYSCIFGCYNGAMNPFMMEILPPQIRATGWALAYSLAVAIFGGFTPAICTYLIHATGNRAMPAVWLTMAALIGLGATMLSGWSGFKVAKLESTVSSD
jgi:MFS family permease